MLALAIIGPQMGTAHAVGLHSSSMNFAGPTPLSFHVRYDPEHPKRGGLQLSSVDDGLQDPLERRDRVQRFDTRVMHVSNVRGPAHVLCETPCFQFHDAVVHPRSSTSRQ